MSVPVILILRIYAMYGGNKRLLLGLLVLLCGRVIAEFIMLGPIVADGAGELAPIMLSLLGADGALEVVFNGVPGGLEYHPSDVWRFWIPSLIFEPMLFLLAVGRLPDAIRTSTNEPSQMLRLLIRDSMVYFGGEMAVILINAITFSVARVSSLPRTLNCSPLEQKLR